MKEITITAVTENVSKVVDFVNELLEEKNCSIKVQTKIDVAIDEIFANVANYAYGDKLGDLTVQVDFKEDYIEGNPAEVVNITFIDSGIPYNPLENEDPDTSLSAEERGIGGLGIFIVKKSMDKMNYEYKDGKNVLTIIKKLE